MYGPRGPQALGYTASRSLSQLGEQQARVEVVDVERSVGNSHEWAHYLDSSSLGTRLAYYTFLEPTDEETTRN
jgi:hypothetical protein